MGWWREQVKHYPFHAMLASMGYLTTIAALTLVGVSVFISALVALYGVFIFAVGIEAGDLLWKYIYPKPRPQKVQRRDVGDAFLDFLSWIIVPALLTKWLCGV